MIGLPELIRGVHMSDCQEHDLKRVSVGLLSSYAATKRKDSRGGKSDWGDTYGQDLGRGFSKSPMPA